MRAHLFLMGLLLPLYCSAVTAADAKQQCPVVNCDCSAIDDSYWRAVCSAREAKVIEDCIANQGRPKSYCGLHGPAAFPVATSIQPDKGPLKIENNDPAIIEKLIATQNWSLDDSLTVLKNREQAKQYGDAIQIVSLLERDLERLYQLHRQANVVFKNAEKDDALKIIDSYAFNIKDRGKVLHEYSTALWRSVNNANSDRSQKALRALAFKLARLAASAYEYSGQIYSLAGVPVNSAESWQAAAEVAQVLQGWERETENKAQHVAFYQAQAAARWHRATFFLIAAGHGEAVAAAAQKARSMDGQAVTEVADTNNHDHESAEDVRAIKRSSR